MDMGNREVSFPFHFPQTFIHPPLRTRHCKRHKDEVDRNPVLLELPEIEGEADECRCNVGHKLRSPVHVLWEEMDSIKIDKMPGPLGRHVLGDRSRSRGHLGFGGVGQGGDGTTVPDRYGEVPGGALAGPDDEATNIFAHQQALCLVSREAFVKPSIR